MIAKNPIADKLNQTDKTYRAVFSIRSHCEIWTKQQILKKQYI